MPSHPIPAEPPPRRVAVLGLGLVGGSLARALAGRAADAGPRTEVRGWTPDEADARAASEAGVLAAPVGTLTDAVDGADTVVLAAPLAASLELLGRIAEAAPPDATVTDVVSLKAAMARAAERAGLTGRWVGGHPMAGGEASGFGASRADLFVGATVWTTSAGADPDHVRSVHELWSSVGAHPAPIDAVEHDRLMALVSHLPQVVSNALAGVLADAGIAPGQLGPGGRDATRLAASSPTMWGDLLGAAPPELAVALRDLARALDDLAHDLEAGDVTGVVAAMERTRAWRVGR